MFTEGTKVVVDKAPERYVLARKLMGRVGRVVADPVVVKGVPVRDGARDGWVEVDFRDASSKDDAPEIYRIDRTWLSGTK